MNRRTFFKTITGFATGVVAMFLPTAKSIPPEHVKEFDKRARETVDTLTIDKLGKCRDELKEAEKKQKVAYRFEEHRGGPTLCHQCSSRFCDAKKMAMDVTTQPKYEPGALLTTPCGRTYRYVKWVSLTRAEILEIRKAYYGS